MRVTCKELQHLVPHVVLSIFERASKLCEHGRVLIPGELLLTSITASSLKRVRELCASWQLNVPFNTNPRDAPLILTDIKVCFAGKRARPPVDRQASVSQSPSSTLRASVTLLTMFPSWHLDQKRRTLDVAHCTIDGVGVWDVSVRNLVRLATC